MGCYVYYIDGNEHVATGMHMWQCSTATMPSYSNLTGTVLQPVPHVLAAAIMQRFAHAPDKNVIVDFELTNSTLAPVALANGFTYVGQVIKGSVDDVVGGIARGEVLERLQMQPGVGKTRLRQSRQPTRVRSRWRTRRRKKRRKPRQQRGQNARFLLQRRRGRPKNDQSTKRLRIRRTAEFGDFQATSLWTWRLHSVTLRQRITARRGKKQPTARTRTETGTRKQATSRDSWTTTSPMRTLGVMRKASS